MVEFDIDAMCKLLVDRYMLKIDISQKIGIDKYIEELRLLSNLHEQK